MKITSSDLTHEDVDRIIEIVNKVEDVDLQLTIGDLELRVRKGNVNTLPELEEQTTSNHQSSISEDLGTGELDERGSILESTHKDMLIDASSSLGAIAAEHVETHNVEEKLATIVAPMTGRFYSRPSPSEPAFVSIGSRITEDDSVCMLEIMKLFTTIRAGLTGEVVEILVQDGQMIEENDVLFKVRS